MSRFPTNDPWAEFSPPPSNDPWAEFQAPPQEQASAAPQIPGLRRQGNVNLHNRPRVQNADGSISTVKSMSFGTDEGEVLVPTISDDGRVLTSEEAIAQYRQTGRSLGVFDTPENATAYAQTLHGQQEQEYAGGATPENYEEGFRRELRDLTVQAQQRGEPGISNGAQIALLDSWRARAGLPPLQRIHSPDEVQTQMDNRANAESPIRDYSTGIIQTAAHAGLNIARTAGSAFGMDGDVIGDVTAAAQRNVDRAVGTPQGLAGTLGGITAGVPMVIAAGAAGGPVGLAGFMGSQGYGGVKEDIHARREAGEEISRTREELTAGITGTVDAALGLVLGNLTNKAGVGAKQLLEKMGVEGFKQFMGRAAASSGVNAGANALQTFTDNVIAKVGYDPNRDLSQGVVESAATGALTGPAFDLMQKPGPRRIVPNEEPRRVYTDIDTSDPTPAPKPEGVEVGSKVTIHGNEWTVTGKTDTGMLEIRDADGLEDTADPSTVTASKSGKPTDADLAAMSDEELAKAYPDIVKVNRQQPKEEIVAAIRKQADEAEANAPKTYTAEQAAKMVGDKSGQTEALVSMADKDGEFVEAMISPDDLDTDLKGIAKSDEMDMGKVRHYATDSNTPPPILAVSSPSKKGKLYVADGRHRVLAEAARNVLNKGRPEDAKIKALVPVSWMKAERATPTKVSKGRNAPAKRVAPEAAEYAKQAGIKYDPDPGYADIDPARAKHIADLYEKAVHDPNDPKVKKSYDAFKKETLDQWNFLKQKGVKFEPWKGEGQPYKNSADMIADVDKGHLFFFQGGDLPADHPLAAKAEGDLTYNDVFRAVHDYFGHSKDGNQFGPRGEENAWMAHSGMYSDEAKPAMTTETRGQNSWVNFGPKGDFNRANPTKTVYAQQKAALLPTNAMLRGGSQRPSSQAYPAGSWASHIPVPGGGTAGGGTPGKPPAPPTGGGPTPPAPPTGGGPTPPAPGGKGPGPSNPIDLPAKVKAAQEAEGPAPLRDRVKGAVGGMLRALESSATKRPPDWVQAKDRLAASKALASKDALAGSIHDLKAMAKKDGLNLDDRAMQFQITEALHDASSNQAKLPKNLQGWVNRTRNMIDAGEQEIVAQAKAVGMDDYADSVKARLGTYLAAVPIKHSGFKSRPSTGARRERLPDSFGHFRRDAYVLTDGNGKFQGRFDTDAAAQAEAAKLRSTKTGKGAIIDIHEPLPVEWRQANEVHDPRFLVGRTMVEARHMVEMLKLIKAGQPFIESVPKGLTDRETAQWARDNDLQQLPTDRKLGPLSGQYLPIRMAEDVVEFTHAPGQATRIWLNLLGAWKMGKTVFNIPTHGHNILSNAFVFAMADGNSPLNPQNWKHYGSSMKEIVTRSGKDWRYLAENNAVGVGGRVSDEMRGIFDQRAGDFDSYTSNRARLLARKGGRFVQDVYGAEDDLFKLAAFKSKKAQGMNDEQALAEVRAAYPDPSRASKFAKMLRNVPLGSPFVTFTDQAIRIAGRQARAHPLRMAAISAFPVLLNALSRAWVDPDKNEEKLIEGRSWAEPMLPWRDNRNRLQTLDLRYIIPLVNDVLPDQRNGVLNVPIVGNNPAFVAGAEQLFGTERFTGKRFVDDKMSMGENIKARVGQAAKTLNPLPSMLSYGVPEIRDAAKGKNERVLSYAILNQLSGLNIRTPYIAERNVRKVARNMMLQDQIDAAESLVDTWNKSYKPGNMEDMSLRSVADGARQSIREQMTNAIEQAGEALFKGDRNGAKQIIKEYNDSLDSDIGQIDIRDAEAEAARAAENGRRY